VPESRSSSRNTDEASVFPGPGGGGQGLARGELRLRVVRTLPPTHLRYLFEEIRKLCRNYLDRGRVSASEMTPEELVSEVWQKLLGTVSLDVDEPAASAMPNPTGWTVADTPDGDGRVVWLIEEIGGSAAIGHRYEDILRQRYGRYRPDLGRPVVQPGTAEDPPEMSLPPAGDDALHAADARLALRGLLSTAEEHFQRDDDIFLLLRLLTDDPGILEDSAGGQWPVTAMVASLNRRFAPPPWSAGRVDQAKRRLIRWIERLMHRNGLDATDLEGLFARVARQKGSGERTSSTRLHYSGLPS
jgi:hypothetical protein